MACTLEAPCSGQLVADNENNLQMERAGCPQRAVMCPACGHTFWLGLPVITPPPPPPPVDPTRCRPHGNLRPCATCVHYQRLALESRDRKKGDRVCRCGNPLPKFRIAYCSDQCVEEAHKLRAPGQPVPKRRKSIFLSPRSVPMAMYTESR